MNAVGADEFKGKSMIAVIRSFDEAVASPYEVGQTQRTDKVFENSFW